MFARILFIYLLTLQFCLALTIYQDGKKVGYQVILVVGDSVGKPVVGDLVRVGDMTFYYDGFKTIELSGTLRENRVVYRLINSKRIPFAVRLSRRPDYNGDGEKDFDVVNPLSELTLDECAQLRCLEINAWKENTEPRLGRIDFSKCYLSFTINQYNSIGKLPQLNNSLQYFYFDSYMDSLDFSFTSEVTQLLYFSTGRFSRLNTTSVVKQNRSLKWLIATNITSEVLSSFHDMKHLRLTGSGIEDLSFLKNMPKLLNANFDNSTARSLPAFKHPSLNSLKLIATKIHRNQAEAFQKLNPHCDVNYGWQQSLDKALKGVGRLDVVGGRGYGTEVLFTTTEPKLLKDFIDLLKVVEQERSGAACGCGGSLIFKFYNEGECQVLLAQHHGIFLSWGGGQWNGHASFRDGYGLKLAELLAEHGIKSMLREIKDDEFKEEFSKQCKELFGEGAISELKRACKDKKHVREELYKSEKLVKDAYCLYVEDRTSIEWLKYFIANAKWEWVESAFNELPKSSDNIRRLSEILIKRDSIEILEICLSNPDLVSMFYIAYHRDSYHGGEVLNKMKGASNFNYFVRLLLSEKKAHDLLKRVDFHRWKGSSFSLENRILTHLIEKGESTDEKFIKTNIAQAPTEFREELTCLFNQSQAKKELIKKYEPYLIDKIDNISEGLEVIKSNGLYGISDKNGKTLITPKYQEIKLFNRKCFLVLNGSLWRLLNFKEEVLSDIQFEDWLCEEYGLLLLAKEKYYYVGADTNVVELPKLDGLEYSKVIYNGMISVADHNYNCGIIDTKGKLIVKVQFESVRYFENNILLAQKGEVYNFYDLRGTLLKSLKIKCLSDYFVNGWITVELKNELIALMDKSLRMKKFPLCEFVDPIDCGVVFEKYG